MQVVLLFDTPTLAHIPALLSGIVGSGRFSKYLWKHAKDSTQHKVRAVFHLCGDGVLEDERYKAFMDDFGPDVHVRIGLVFQKSCYRSYGSTLSLRAGIFRIRLHLRALPIASFD